MSFVVDASMTTAWVVADEQNAESDRLAERAKREGAQVPDLFWHEMRNILLKIERRGRSISGWAEVALATLRRFPLSVLPQRSDAAVPGLARAHDLTAYDTAYLDLAIASGLALATLDRALASAAHACGVALLGPLTP